MKPLLIGLEAHAPLLDSLASSLGLPRGEAALGSFADGERMVRIQEDLAGRSVILVGSTGPPVDSNLMTMAFLADAARRAGAHSVLAVVPYFGYSRSERLADPGAPIGARVAADLLQGAGVSQLVTLDLHSPAIAGFFTIPVFEERAAPILAACYPDAHPDTHVVVSPDAGGIKGAGHFASLLGLPLAVAVKHRLAPDTPRVLHLWGEVSGRVAIIRDDMITTGGTLEQVGRLLLERNAQALEVVATHAVMAPGARERLRGLGVRRLITTDSLPHPEADWEVLPIAPLLAPRLARCMELAAW